jgi:hypothetical protein
VGGMNKLYKIYWSAINRIIHKGKWKLRAECRLYDLRCVVIMPMVWYRVLFRVGMMALKVKCRWVHRRADWIVHRVPYNVRFELS